MPGTRSNSTRELHVGRRTGHGRLRAGGLGDREEPRRRRPSGGRHRPRHPGQPQGRRQAATGRRGALRRPHRPRRGRRTDRRRRAERRSSTWPRSSRRSSTCAATWPRRSTSAPPPRCWRPPPGSRARPGSCWPPASRSTGRATRTPITDVLTADTPVNPADVYGAHKAAAEKLVRASSLDWVILRLGGVLTVDPAVVHEARQPVLRGTAARSTAGSRPSTCATWPGRSRRPPPPTRSARHC